MFGKQLYLIYQLLTSSICRFACIPLNKYCNFNKRFKKVEKLTNTLTNKDLDIQMFLSGFLDEIFVLL